MDLPESGLMGYDSVVNFLKQDESIMSSETDPRATERKIAELGGVLAAKFRTVLGAIPNAPKRAVELSTFLGIDKTLSVRLVGAINKNDPLAVCHAIPGPRGLRTALAAARAKGAPAKLVADAQTAVGRLEESVQELGGSRSAFNTIIGGLLPDVRGRIERRNKKAAFDAMCNLLGYQVDTSFVTVAIQPSDEDSSLCNSTCFTGKTGLRHLAPRVSRMIWAQKCGSPGSDVAPSSFTLDGEPITTAQAVPVIREFSTKPLPGFRLYQHNETTYVALAGDELPSVEHASIFTGSFSKNSFGRYRAPEATKEFVSCTPSEPAKVVFIDVLIRDDLWPDTHPELAIYRTGPRGNLPLPDARPFDRIDLLESVTFLGQGTDRIHTNDVENYAAMVRQVLDRVGWESERFRAYRVRVEYPILHAQIMISFDLPPAGASPTPS